MEIFPHSYNEHPLFFGVFFYFDWCLVVQITVWNVHLLLKIIYFILQCTKKIPMSPGMGLKFWLHEFNLKPHYCTLAGFKKNNYILLRESVFRRLIFGYKSVLKKLSWWNFRYFSVVTIVLKIIHWLIDLRLEIKAQMRG